MKIKIVRTEANERAVIEYNNAMRKIAQEAKDVGLGRVFVDELIINHNALVDERNKLIEEKEIVTKKLSKLEDEIKRASHILAQVKKGTADYDTINDGINAKKLDVSKINERVAEIDGLVARLDASIKIASKSKKEAEVRHKDSARKLFASFNKLSEHICKVEKLSKKNLYFEFVRHSLMSSVLNKGESKLNTKDLFIEIDDEFTSQIGEEE